MKGSLFATIAAAFVSFASAYTTPVGDTPEGNPISKPGANEIVPVGQPYTITWNPTSPGTVTLVLLRGPGDNIKPLYAIVEKIANTGTYSWTPSAELEPDVTRYGIQLIDDATGKYQYTTQFGISNPGFGGALSTTTTSSSTSSSSYPPSTTSTSATTDKVVPETYVTPTTTGSTTSGGYVTSGSLIYSTSLVTVTSCGPAVTNCPYKNNTSTTVPTYPVPSTYKSPNATGTAIQSVSPGAGEKVRVGGGLAVVVLAGLSLFL